MVLPSYHQAEGARARGYEEGGLSGTPLFNRAVECVAIGRSAMPDKLLIGVGGISSLEDGERMREAGADCVEIYTSFVYQGPKIVRELMALS